MIMITAINSSKMKVHIDESDIGENYYCPICQQLLIRKMGLKRAHHFAHYNPRGKGEYTPCTDKWCYDKSEWHIEWQNRFPKDSIEYVVFDGHNRHFADVLINGIVIEFQHSPISYDNFTERNDFYIRCGYKVVWIFDQSNEWKKEIIKRKAKNEYIWENPHGIFRKMNIEDEKAVVFFQFSNNGLCVEKVTSCYNFFKKFYTDIENALSIFTFVDYAINNNFKIFEKVLYEEENHYQSDKTSLSEFLSRNLLKNDTDGSLLETLLQKIREKQYRENVRKNIPPFNENNNKNIQSFIQTTQMTSELKLFKEKNLRCKYCGKTGSEKEFVSWGGKGETNFGRCRECRIAGRDEILPEIEEILNSNKSESDKNLK